jgi:hypothetical protein
MRQLLLGCAILALAASPAAAKVYYINQGVKYHIGDDHYAKSTDPAFVGTYPVVGREWIQAFSVDRPDHVRVRIEHVWAVDDCDYCKDLVWIDEALMGRLYAKDNGVGFDSLDPMVHEVVPGKVYYLKIESVGLQADDFVVENVIVESDKSEITLMEPGPILKNAGDPMPRIYPPARRRSSACEGLPVNHNWMLGWSKGSPNPLSVSATDAFKAGPPLVSLRAGQSVDLDFRIRGVAGGDAVSQPLECLLGNGPYDGWAMLLSGGKGAMQHGNLILGGDYTARALDLRHYAPGQVNRLSVLRCTDGSLRMVLNGGECGASIPSALESVPVSFRSQGLDLEIRSAAVDLAQPAEGLPAAPEESH